MKGYRNQSGNMLSMVALLVGLAFFGCMTAFAFYMLLSQQKSGQTGTDQYALTTAGIINAGDRVGQMNNLIERCRELVYLSRVNNNRAQLPVNKLYIALAAQLLDESRENAKLVEAERKNQMALCVKTLQANIIEHNKNARSGKRLTLPWFESSFPVMNQVRLGYIKKVESNVENLLVIPELREYDIDKKYIQKGSNLYLSNINAKLPEPDEDLDFKFSALPADVNKTISPMRLTSGDAFTDMGAVFLNDKPTQLKLEQLPGAIQIIEKMEVGGNDKGGTVNLVSTATAGGASPCP